MTGAPVPGTRDIKPDDFVPVQMGVMLREALDRVRDKIESSKYTEKNVKNASEAFAARYDTEGKNRRTEVPAEDL